MKLIVIILSALTLFVGTCSQDNPKTTDSQVDAATAVRLAEQTAMRVRLPSELEAARTDLKKLARVYLDAEEVGSTAIQAEADRRMTEIVLRKMTSFPSRGRARKLLKQVPENSLAAEAVAQSKTIWD